MTKALTTQTTRDLVQVDDLVAEWLASIDVAPDTRLTYRLGLAKFVIWLDGQPATPTMIRRWRDELRRRYSPSTANLRLAAVRSFYSWALDAGRIGHDPSLGVKGATRRGTSKVHKRDELTASEVLAVLDICGDDATGTRDRAMIALMAYTGIRSIEVHRADGGDLRSKDGRLVLWVQGKGKQERDDFVVLAEGALIELRKWLAIRDGGDDAPLFTSLAQRNRGKRLSRAAIRAAVKRRFKAAGVTGSKKTTHSLRHSAISAAIRGGASVPMAQSMARHSNPNTTLIYYHEVNRTQNAAEDLIDYGA